MIRAKPGADLCLIDVALLEVAERFPDDVRAAMAAAQALRAGPPAPPDPVQEPWPPMQVPE